MRIHTDSGSEVETLKGAVRAPWKAEAVSLCHLPAALDPWARWRTNTWTFILLRAPVHWTQLHVQGNSETEYTTLGFYTATQTSDII